MVGVNSLYGLTPDEGSIKNKYFGTQFFFEPKFFQTQNFFGLKFFWTQNLFQISLGPKNLWTLSLLT